MRGIRLSYSTFGLTDLDLLSAIDVVGKAGYTGIEMAFHRRQLDPFDASDEDFVELKHHLQEARLETACVATASYFFTPSRPHEPSLLALDLAGRKRRIDLIKRGIRAARHLGAPFVTFGSGFLRDEHARSPSVNPRTLLIEGVQECLRDLHDDENITLLIEPEPGMFIETLEQGLSLIKEVGSPRFGLHVDLCHAYCSETDYIRSLSEAAPWARYLHVSDAERGYNLKIENDAEDVPFDLDAAAKLIYFPDNADYLLVDRRHPLYFCDASPDLRRRRRIDVLLDRAGVDKSPEYIDYPSLYAGSSDFDDEIWTYLISVPGLSYEVLERAKPVIAYLRGVKNPPRIRKRVANTRTGITHFHEIPGEGTLDFAASFNALACHGFSGYATIELYHHNALWESALLESYRRLAPYINV